MRGAWRRQPDRDSNLKDFRRLPAGITAIHPDDFLCLLLDQTPAALAAAIGAQVSRLKNPPMSLTDLLDRYALIAPKFVSAWRARFPEASLQAEA